MAEPTQSELGLEPEPGYEHFQNPEPGTEQNTAPEAELEPEDEGNVDVEMDEAAQLRAQLADAQERESELNRRIDAERARLDQFIERPTHQPQQEIRVDPYNSPDPIADPEGYKAHNAALHLQGQRDTQRMLVQSQQEMQQSNQLNSLWTQFQTQHPEMAHLEDLAGIAFQRVTGGVIPSDTSRLVEDVHKKMIELSGGAAGSQDSPTKPVNRTGGIAGGSATPSKPTKKAPVEEPVKTLADQLFDVQHNVLGIV